VGDVWVGSWLLVGVDGHELAGAETVAGTVYGDGGHFEVGVGVHRGSASGLLLFVVVVCSEV